MGQIIKLNIRFDREKHYLSVDVALVTSHLLVFVDFPLSTTTGREHKLPTCPKLWLYCGILSLIHIYLCAFAIQPEQHYIKSEVYLTSFQGKYLFYHISFISNSPLFWKSVIYFFFLRLIFSVSLPIDKIPITCMFGIFSCHNKRIFSWTGSEIYLFFSHIFCSNTFPLHGIYNNMSFLF